MNQSDKGNSDMEAEFEEFPNKESSDGMFQHGKSNSSFLERENMGEYFSQKIREIDKDLGIYENPTFLAQAENIISNKESSPLFDLGNLRNNLEENQSVQRVQNLIHTPHDGRGTPLHEITNAPQVPVVIEATLLAKWKRYPRVADSSLVTNDDIPTTKDDVLSSKRSINTFTDQSELPSKKILVSYNDKENFPIMAEAGSQPRQAQ